MEDYGTITTIEFDDQEKDRIAAALRVLVDEMPSSSNQQSPNPVHNEVIIDLLSDEDEEYKKEEEVIVCEENYISSEEEEVLGFLTYNSSNEALEFPNNTSNKAPVCEVIQPSISSVSAEPSPACLEPIDNPTFIINSDFSFLNELETESTLSAGEKNDVTFSCSPLTGSSRYSATEVIELTESYSEPDLNEQSDYSNDYNAKEDVQFFEQRIQKGANDEHANYYCPICGIDCGCVSSWKMHTEKEHNFGSLEAANMESIVTKQGNLSRRCRDCQQTFPLNIGFTRLILHRITHLPFPKYVGCRLCRIRFGNKSLYLRHIRRNHADVTSISAHQHDNPLDYIRITCHVCKQQQNSVSGWKNHLRNDHDYYTKAKSKYVNTGNSFTCTVCGLSIYVVRDLMFHMLTHEVRKTFRCTYCNSFQSNSLTYFNVHVRGKHLRTKKVSFQCTYCKAAFKTRKLRASHYEADHKAQLKRCKVCKKAYENVSLLLRHITYHHSLK